jgi:hypothetical protein
MLWGREGDDTFIFERGRGNDTVGDFQDGFDLLNFESFGYADKDAVLDLASQDGANVVFSLAINQTVTLNNFDIALLGGEDIII